MTDEITEGVRKWTLNEMLEPADGAAKKNKKDKAMEWGRPGHLVQQELDVYVAFQKEVESRGGEFKNTIYSFSEVEGAAFALTRWLRARKYNLADTVTMVEEATEERAKPRAVDYYPDPAVALGVDVSTFISQYPQLYTGFSKSGCPVFYSKPGVLNIDGVECITTLDGILKYHWHVMQHDYKERLLQFKKENPSFSRFECVSVLDLSGLAVSALNSRTMDIIKKQAFIDSLCFPETMNKMLVVNAPRFFSASWSIIKGFVDARTAGKIEVLSSSSAAEKKLKEIIDLDQLPKDYGGTAESTNVLLLREAGKEAANGGRSRLVAEVMYVRSSLSYKFVLFPDEEADVWVHTRAKGGANFKLTDADTKTPLLPLKKVIHTGNSDDNSTPTKVHLSPSRISGATGSDKITVKVKAEGLTTRMTSESYLLVANIYKKE